MSSGAPVGSRRLHVVGLPHTETTAAYATCAYTQKIVKFCRMAHGRGRDVILYAGEANEAPCDEHVVCVTRAQQRRLFGEHDEHDIRRGGFDWNQPGHWVEFNGRCAAEIAARYDPTDLLLIVGGQAQQQLADMLPQLIVAEYGVGYEGVITVRPPGASSANAAFESHAHRHYVYGRNGWSLYHDHGRGHDVVIPNFFDPDELPYGDGGDHLLFVGRLIASKGVQLAVEIARTLNRHIVIAGPGGSQDGDTLTFDFGNGIVAYDRMEYVGAVGIRERARLMGAAGALLVPSLYAEPFGGVAVEAMMCGTPAVTTDIGAFTETVVGDGGYRFTTFLEALAATQAALSRRGKQRRRTRAHALANYSLAAVWPRYTRWFGQLDLLWQDGWWTGRAASPAAARLEP